MEQEHGILLNTAIQEVIKAIRWIHEHAEPKAAGFLTEVQSIYADSPSFHEAFNQLQLDPDLAKATADLGSAMGTAKSEDFPRLKLLVDEFVEAQKDFKPLDPLKAYQRGEGIGMDALKSNVSLEIQMKGEDEQDSE